MRLVQRACDTVELRDGSIGLMLHRAWERLVATLTGIPPVSVVRRDPWRPLPLEPPLRAFGPGAALEFAEYLTGDSSVTTTSPHAVARWLQNCRYASDPDLLGEMDAWLHPLSLELVRSGDCEDFALWGWRKLVELRLDAHFVVGLRHHSDGASKRHAWVIYRDGPEHFLFDGVEPAHDRIIRPLDAVRKEYEPQVGVTPVAARYVFAGLFLSDWGRRLPLRRVRAP